MFQFATFAFRAINRNYIIKESLQRHCSISISRNANAVKNTKTIPIYRNNLSALGLYRYCSSTVFIQNENAYAYSVLRGKEVYKNTLATEFNPTGFELSEDELNNIIHWDWSEKSPEFVVHGFKRMTSFCSKNGLLLSDEKFDRIVGALIEKMPFFHDDDVVSILGCLKKWPRCSASDAHNYGELWKAVDDECVVRMVNWDRNKRLFVADHWFVLNLGRYSRYMHSTVIKLGHKADNLQPHQLVQCMFYINSLRNFPQSLNVYEFEYNLLKSVEQLSVDELAILAMGFFKSKKPIRNPQLLNTMMRLAMKELDTVHEIALAALMKVIRYSLGADSSDVLCVFLDKLVSQIDRLSLLCCMHIALAGSDVHLYHKSSIDKIVDKLVREISSCRLKDLERLAFALSLYNYEDDRSPTIFEMIAEELQKEERAQEIKLYPRCLPCCLQFLSQRGIYLHKEISRVLSMSFIRETYGKNNFKIGREILYLDASVELECPEYRGNRLDPQIRNFLIKRYTDKVWCYEDLLNRKLSMTDRMLLEVYSAAVSIFGADKKVFLGHVVPHRERADVIFGLRSDGSLVNIPTDSCTHDTNLFKKADVDNVKWFCIIAGGWNCYVRNTNQPVGSLTAKLRHLHLSGYTAILVPHFEWNVLSTPADQQKYLFNKIYDKIDNRLKRVNR